MKLDRSVVFSKNPYQWWRISTFILLGLMLGSLIFSGFAVYNYTFRSLEDAHTIVLLNINTVSNNVNITNYQKAVGLINSKETVVAIPASLRNIFNFSNVPAVQTQPTTPTTVAPSQDTGVATTTIN